MLYYYMIKWVFNFVLKLSSDVAFLISNGSLFHNLGAAQKKKYIYIYHQVLLSFYLTVFVTRIYLVHYKDYDHEIVTIFNISII